MKAVKALVFFMALLLVAGLGLLGWGLMHKTRPAGQPSAAVAAAGEFGRVEVPVPAGARVEQALPAGERIVLRLSGSGPERFLVLEPASGRVLGSFDLAPQPPSK